jgi:hypothetical protein
MVASTARALASATALSVGKPFERWVFEPNIEPDFEPPSGKTDFEEPPEECPAELFDIRGAAVPTCAADETNGPFFEPTDVSTLAASSEAHSALLSTALSTASEDGWSR